MEEQSHEGEVVETKPKKKRASAKAKKAAAEPISTQVEEALAATEAQASETLAFVASWSIQDQAEMDDAGALLAQCVAKKRELEAELKEITAPMRLAEKRVRDKWKPAIAYLEQSEAAIKGAMRSFELQRLQEQKEAQRLVAESGGQVDAATLVVAHGQNQVQLASQVSSRQLRRWRIINESLIPEKYFVRLLNEKAIDAELKLVGGKLAIPGIEVYEDVEIKNKPRSAA
jgi:hypothetical protein